MAMTLFFAPPCSHFSHTALQAQPPHIYLTWQGVLLSSRL